jgi:hypothetical protein
MRALTDSDLKFVVRRIPADVRDLLTDNGGSLFLGGGFIRDTIAGLPVKDVDLLGGDKSSLGPLAHGLAQKREGRAHKTDNAVTVLAPPRTPVQFITRWTFDDPEACVASFDFTVCQAVIWRNKGIAPHLPGEWFSMCADTFYEDLAARRLVYTYPMREEEAGGSLMRVRKFLARDWNIQADSLGGVIARVAQKIEWAKINREDRLPADRERAVAQVVTGLLREVDPLLVVDGLDPIEDPGEGA